MSDSSRNEIAGILREARAIGLGVETNRKLDDAISVFETNSNTEREPMNHPATDHLLQFFEFMHLPAHLQTVSMPFKPLAEQMARTLPNNPELTAGLRKLLEAKDCFVRAKLLDK